MGRWQKILLGALSLLLVFTLFGFFVLPPLLKSVAMDKLSVLLHRPVSIARIHINPYELSLQLEGLRIGEREGEATFIGFERLFVDVEATALLQKALVLSEFRLEQPTFRVVRGADQRYNFSDLVEEFLTPGQGGRCGLRLDVFAAQPPDFRRFAGDRGSVDACPART